MRKIDLKVVNDILDTFPIVKRKDEEKHVHYRTKDRILELYDALAECQVNGSAKQLKNELTNEQKEKI